MMQKSKVLHQERRKAASRLPLSSGHSEGPGVTAGYVPVR